jgi:cytochrome o ubiquinol oxidase subunit 2
MSKKTKIIIASLPVVVVSALLVIYLHSHTVAVLSPAGEVARRERNLFVFALALSAIVVLPVFFLTIMIAVKYREGNKKAKYTPDWDRSKLFESIWWGVPMAIILVLSIVTWNSSHSLDPYKALASKTPAMPVEVVALDWKWLFIYPTMGVATVNRLEMPVNTPVHFTLTSDTVMNSFWIPRLGGQIYAMPGMTTQLNLVANKVGSFYGSSANISGVGFASMNFKAVAVSNQNFHSWLSGVKNSPKLLDQTSYKTLAEPGSYYPVSYYSEVDDGLFGDILNNYMASSSGSSSSSGMNMNMDSGSSTMKVMNMSGSNSDMNINEGMSNMNMKAGN